MKKLIILDRDGVINIDSQDYVKSPDEWHPIPGSLEAIALLNNQGYKVVIATNQAGIGRGMYDHDTLSHIHQKMHAALAVVGGKIDKIFYCPHHPQDNCQCRKPKPGLLQQIAREYQVSLENVPFVGDSWRDIQAATAAKAKPVLVLTGNGTHTQQKHADKLQEVLCTKDLYAFAQTLVG